MTYVSSSSSTLKHSSSYNSKSKSKSNSSAFIPSIPLSCHRQLHYHHYQRNQRNQRNSTSNFQFSSPFSVPFFQTYRLRPSFHHVINRRHRSVFHASVKDPQQQQQTPVPEPIPEPPTTSSAIPSSIPTSSSSTAQIQDANGNGKDITLSDKEAEQKADAALTLNARIARIALPALGTLALDPLVALADMACVGHLGARAIGGVGIGNNVFNLSFTCFNFLALATTPLIARAYAKDDKREASKLIAQGLWIAFISGIVATVVLSIYSRPILQFFGANEAILPYAMDYLQVRIIAAPFFLTSMVGNGTFRGFQDTKTPLFIGLFSNLLNLILYPTLIFAFKLGTKGAGIAMSTGQICTGIILLYLLIKTKKLSLTDMHFSNFPKLHSILPLLKTGMILSVRTFSIYSTISYATATAAKMGTIQIAAFEIGRQIFALFARLFDAISVAAQSLISLSLGKNDLQLARKISNRILRISILMGFGFISVLMLIVNFAPNIFTQNILVRQTVQACFPFMAIIQPINGLVFVLDGIYTAGRKFSILSSVIFVSALIASSFLYFVRCSTLPLQYVWLGLNIMMVLRASVLGYIYTTKWSPVPRKKFRDDGALLRQQQEIDATLANAAGNGK